MQTEPKQPSQELIESLLAGKSDAIKKQVWEILAKTKIPPDDPIFLVLVAMGTIEASIVDIPRTLERREEVLSRIAQVLEEQGDDLERVANDIVKVSQKLNSDLERMVKVKLPQTRAVQPKLKELILVGAIGLLFGTIFGRPVVDLAQCQISQNCPPAQVKK